MTFGALSFSFVLFGFIPEIHVSAGVLSVFCAGLLIGTAHWWLAERLTFRGFGLCDSYFESCFGICWFDFVGIGLFFCVLS